MKFAVLLSCLYIYVVWGEEGNISCSVESVEPDKDTVLECKFPENLNVSKKDFTIYHYTSHGISESVVDCWWIKGNLDCFIKSGFEYNKTVNTKLAVKIRSVTSSHLGNYACQAAGYGPNFLKFCNLLPRNGTEKTCVVNKKESQSNATLTCYFSEDIGKTQRNFTVEKYNDHSRTEVIKCWWIDGHNHCNFTDGYLNISSLSSYYTVLIPEVTTEKEGNYSCWHSGSDTNQKMCLLRLSDKETAAEESSGILVIVLMSTLLSVAVVAALAVTLSLIYRRKRLHSSKNTAEDNQESMPMLEEKEKEKRTRVTEDLQEYLERRVKDMYPDINETFYFVPPVYFNKIHYTLKTVANEEIYVPDRPTENDERHDRAMQHVLHCLHHMAEEMQEQMFVLTELNYEDYLINVDKNCEIHCLPKPTSVTREYTTRFDLLIIHRQLGVLVGVVNAVGESSQQNSDKMITAQIQESMKQLQEAGSIMSHLVSDQQPNLKIHKALILPNLSYSSLQRAVARQPDQILHNTELYLCADHVSQPATPWDISAEQINKLKQWWSKVMEINQDEIKMNDELYLKLISRFCGSATHFNFQRHEHRQQPVKTLAESVSLTGELYERFTLYPDMLQLLERKKVFIVGPPNTGKTRLLTLAGKNWIKSGHYVQVFSGNSVPCEFLKHAFGYELKEEPFTVEYDKYSPSRAYFRNCNFTKDKEVDTTVDSLLNTRRERTLYVLVDEVDLCSKPFKKFCKRLKNRCSDVHLWATSSTDQDVPEGWETFTRIVNCPPAVVREASRSVTAIPAAKNTQQHYLFPSDGPPVKYFYRKMDHHDYKECGRRVGDYVVKHLITRNDKSVTQESISLEGSPPRTTAEKNPSNDERCFFLQNKDLLILFDGTINEGEKFVEGLRASGIDVQTFKTEKDKDINIERIEFAFAMHVEQVHIFRPRKKIVVYVESNSGSRDQLKKWRGMMCCTSQLIFVRRAQK